MSERNATQELIDLAHQASAAILSIYQNTDLWAVEHKADESPLTAADLASHHCLLPGLKKILDVPVLSEESPAEDLVARHQWPIYWLVDPLDGTREFLARNDEFVINIALVVGNRAVIGLIHQPTTGVTYLGTTQANPLLLPTGASKWLPNSQPMRLVPSPTVSILNPSARLRVLVSHRHSLGPTQDYLKTLSAIMKCEIKTISLGSALKFGYLAERLADFYPRLGPTSEWDTAAGQAVLEAVGGALVDFERRIPLSYNTKSELLNPHFLASADARIKWP